jgi:hypothetical protein
MRLVRGTMTVRLVLPFLRAIRVYALGDSVAVNAEGFGGVRDSFLVPGERFLNIELFEFFQSFIQHDVTIKHVFYNCFQAGAYLHLSPVLLS